MFVLIVARGAGIRRRQADRAGQGRRSCIAPEGTIVEQTTQSAPFEALIGGNDIAGETRYQDLIDALTTAKNDARIAVIVLDLEHLTGVSPAHLGGLGDASGRGESGR